MSVSRSCRLWCGVSTGPAPGAGRGAAAKRCRGVRGAGPLRRGEFERGIPLSCCRPGKALFIPYNSVLYKKGRPHRPVMNTGGRPGANRLNPGRFAFCIRSSYTVGAPPAISRRNGPRVIKSARAGNAVDVPPATLCALIAHGVHSVRRAYNRRRPVQIQAPIRRPAQNRDWNWAHGRYQCRRQPGVCTVGRKRVSLSQLCGGRVRAGSVRLPATFFDDGACGVAAVCRRPVKDPPRQFGERAFTGFPWMPAANSSLRHLHRSRSKRVRRVALHLFLSIPRWSVEQAIIARSF